MTAELDRPVAILDIVEEHFEELDFLWEQREAVVFAPDWNLQELADHEERAEAHLDGLRIARGHAVDLARPALAGDAPGAATAATFVMMSFANPSLEQEIVRALESGPPEVREGIRVGLRHSDVSRITGDLRRLATSGELDVRIAATDVLAFHRLPAPDDLGGLVRSVEIDRAHSILPSIGRFGGPWGMPDLQRALVEGPARVQRSALETSARLGMQDLADVCRRQAGSSPAALAFLGIVGQIGDLPLLQTTLDSGDVAFGEAALSGVGALGHVSAIPRLIEAMAHEELSHHAGAAFTRIVGSDPEIEADELSEPSPEKPEEEADFVETVVPADPDKARAWWEEAKGDFSEAVRWQGGAAVPDVGLGEGFHLLPLRTRLDVYLRVRVLDSEAAPDLELEARAIEQRRAGSPSGTTVDRSG